MRAPAPRSDRGFWLGVVLLAVFGVAKVTATAGELLGEKAPAFELESVHGGTVELGSLKGKVVVLDFWAVWCPPCETSMPFFQRLQDEYGEHGLAVVGMHVDDRMPPAGDVKAYLEERGISYENLMSTVETDDGFDVVAMPTTYLVDRNGVLQKRHVGFNPDTTPERLESDVREMLGLE